MKAIQYFNYGSPDVLQYIDVATPTPTDDQVLVKIVCASANPLDWHMMEADPFLVRLEGGLRKPKNPNLGADIAGIVEAVGNNVTEFKVGDAVFGDASAIGLGGFSEYIAVSPDDTALKPDNVTFEQAAAMPVVGFTALQGLRDSGKIANGQKVLVNGASGGVGSTAVMIAKCYGAEVTGVCSTRNLDLVKSIGADHVIDYTKEDFSRNGQQYDLIYDAVGNRPASDFARVLTPTGRAVVAGFSTMSWMFGFMLMGKLRSKKDGQWIGMMGTAQPNKKDLLILADMLRDGKIVPVIDRSYPLSETAEAIRYLETMRARGKVIITVSEA